MFHGPWIHGPTTRRWASRAACVRAFARVPTKFLIVPARKMSNQPPMWTIGVSISPCWWPMFQRHQNGPSSGWARKSLYQSSRPSTSGFGWIGSARCQLGISSSAFSRTPFRRASSSGLLARRARLL